MYVVLTRKGKQFLLNIALRRKEMFCLMIQSIHFNLRLYYIEIMNKDHRDNKRGNPLLPHHELHYLISSKESVIRTIPWTTYHIPRLCYTSCGALARTIRSLMFLP